uniref:Uncharacterized protein n=1 Tax=Salix viminalis TaxID=40686 RepID=A0A6N2KG09_SALVM
MELPKNGGLLSDASSSVELAEFERMNAERQNISFLKSSAVYGKLV